MRLAMEGGLEIALALGAHDQQPDREAGVGAAEKPTATQQRGAAPVQSGLPRARRR